MRRSPPSPAPSVNTVGSGLQTDPALWPTIAGPAASAASPVGNELAARCPSACVQALEQIARATALSPCAGRRARSPAQLDAHLSLIGQQPDAGFLQSVHEHRLRRAMKLVPAVLEIPQIGRASCRERCVQYV